MGFGVRMSQLSGMMLIERADIIDWGWNNISLKWSNDKVMGIQAHVNWEHGLIWPIVEAPNIFLPGAELVYKAGYTAGHFHCHMNSDSFEKWVAGKFILNLPLNAVVVLGNN